MHRKACADGAALVASMEIILAAGACSETFCAHTEFEKQKQEQKYEIEFNRSHERAGLLDNTNSRSIACGKQPEATKR